MSQPLGKRLAAWWFAAVPAERLAAVRILIGAYAWWYLTQRYGYLLSVNRHSLNSWEPIGVVRAVIDKPLDDGLWQGLVIATQLACIAFTLGIFYRVLAPVFAALMLFVLTYSNSWSMVFHTENLLVLHLCALALAPAADAWSLDRWWKARRGAPPPAPDGRYAWAVRTAAVLTVVTYVLAGIAKLRLSGGDWLGGEQLRNQIAFDNLRKVLLGGDASALALPMLEHPKLFIVLALMTIVVEVGAPIALLGGWFAAGWAAAAWGFHVGVILLMGIVFPYPLSGVAFAPLFHVERPVGWIGRTVARGARWLWRAIRRP